MIGSLIGGFFAMFFIACLIVVGGCTLLMGIIKLIKNIFRDDRREHDYKDYRV